MASNKHFHYIVPVWGESFTKLFTDICLPMLLTPGNLLGRNKHKGDKFVIVTQWDDFQAMKKTKSYNQLGKLIEIEVHITNVLVDQADSHAAMSNYYSLAMRDKSVVPGETYFVFLTADSFWTRDSFQKLDELSEEGFKVVMAAGLRVNLEDVSGILKEKIKKSRGNVDIPAEDIIDMAISNIHQMSKNLNLLSNSNFLNCWPSHLYWINDADKQIVAHCFHLHPLMVLSPKKNVRIGTTIDGDFISKLSYPIDSFYIAQNNILGIELSPKKRNWGQTLGEPSIAKIIEFSLWHANKQHWHFFGKRIIINYTHGKPISMPIQKNADALIKKIQQYRSLSRLIHIILPFSLYARNKVKNILNILRRLLQKIASR